MPRIKSISEAFSLQPNEKHVSNDWELTQKIPHIVAIELRHEQVDSDRSVGFYIGFNPIGQEVFKWIASACNVTYYED